MENISKVIDTWLKVQEKLLSDCEDGTWTHGKHYGALDCLYNVKELLEENNESSRRRLKECSPNEGDRINTG